jgi:hypothetical protein
VAGGGARPAARPPTRLPGHQHQLNAAAVRAAEGACSWLLSSVGRILFRQLYASWFVFLITTKRLFNTHHQIWPYRGDLPYFVALWFSSSFCFLGILGIEAYGLFL